MLKPIFNFLSPIIIKIVKNVIKQKDYEKRKHCVRGNKN